MYKASNASASCVHQSEDILIFYGGIVSGSGVYPALTAMLTRRRSPKQSPPLRVRECTKVRIAPVRCSELGASDVFCDNSPRHDWRRTCRIRWGRGFFSLSRKGNTRLGTAAVLRERGDLQQRLPIVARDRRQLGVVLCVRCVVWCRRSCN